MSRLAAFLAAHLVHAPVRCRPGGRLHVMCVCLVRNCILAWDTKLRHAHLP